MDPFHFNNSTVDKTCNAINIKALRKEIVIKHIKLIIVQYAKSYFCWSNMIEKMGIEVNLTNGSSGLMFGLNK